MTYIFTIKLKRSQRSKYSACSLMMNENKERLVQPIQCELCHFPESFDTQGNGNPSLLMFHVFIFQIQWIPLLRSN